MPLLFKAVTDSRLIEYLRAEIDPAKYNPDELNPIADIRFGGNCWGALGIVRPNLNDLRTMAKGRDPITGGRLTARRTSPDSEQPRTALYSTVHNVPKSVSIASEIGGDRRIRGAVHDAAVESLEMIQAECVGLRVRKKNDPERNKIRNTGSMAWITILANESRYLDPCLHVHGAILNVTPDVSDPKRPFKALDVTRVYKDQRRLTRTFNSTLRDKLEGLGYSTIATPRNEAFEIVGIPEDLVRRYSKGNRAIKAASAELAEQARADETSIHSKRLDAKAAERIRPKKPRIFQNQLVGHWRSQVTQTEFAGVVSVVNRAIEKRGSISPAPIKVNLEPQARESDGTTDAPSIDEDPVTTDL